MAFLHGWAGLIPGWLLYAVFLTGTITYYRQELTQWMRPELVNVTADPGALQRGIAYLNDKAPEAALWRIELPTERNPVLEVLWKQDGAGFRSAALDPRTGKDLAARETMGGDFLYYFHFDLNLPGRIGRWLVSFASIAMLVAIISGVITHRRIFADFFTFRPGKGQRSWLDAHNVAGVVALPYHLMITFTGLVTLALMYMPWGIDRAYDGDGAAFASDLVGSADVPARSGVARPLGAVTGMVAEAERTWGNAKAGRVLIAHPGDAAATVTVEQRDSNRISYDRPWLRFDASGASIASHGGGGPMVTTYGVLYGLHLARFSDWQLRLLFFASGLLGTAMVATGLVLWVVKRRPRVGTATSLQRTADGLNLGFIVGLPIAIGLFFLANRIIPAELPGRGVAEIVVFFLGWAATFVHALRRRSPSAWNEQLWICGLLFLSLPVASILLTPAGLSRTLSTGDWQRAAVDLAMFAAGTAIAALAWGRGRKSR